MLNSKRNEKTNNENSVNENTTKKKKISKILNEDRGWHNVKDKLPPIDKPVVIRFINPKFVYYETETEIYLAEDYKIAQCLRDYNDPDNIEKCSWNIIPPYPKFDYSPMSRKDKLLEGVIVTHWTEASDEDLLSWKSRFNIIDSYLTLKVEIDDDHAEVLYHTLMYANAMIGNAYDKEKTDVLLASHILLGDILNSMDKNIHIINGKEVSLSTEYDPSNEDSGENNSDSVSNELKEVINSTKHLLDTKSLNIESESPSDVEKYKINITNKISNILKESLPQTVDDISKNTFDIIMKKIFTEAVGIDIESVPYYCNFEDKMNKPED